MRDVVSGRCKGDPKRAVADPGRFSRAGCDAEERFELGPGVRCSRHKPTSSMLVAGKAPSAIGTSPQGQSAESGVITASYDAPVGPANHGGNEPPTTFPQQQAAEKSDFSTVGNSKLPAIPPDRNGSVPPVQMGSPNASGGLTARLSSESGHPSDLNQVAPDARFKQAQQRLKELGATYYLLESYGDQGDAYRFYCRMAIGGNPHVTEQFYCVDNDALAAMTNVLQQVEAWRKGGVASFAGLSGGTAKAAH